MLRFVSVELLYGMNKKSWGEIEINNAMISDFSVHEVQKWTFYKAS